MIRILHALWLQGREAAPPLVQTCLARWEALNPEYEVRIYERKDVEERLAGFPIPLESLPAAALSDVFRARLLVEEGGVWTDATVLPLEPLVDWLEPRMAGQEYFAFARPGPDRLLASWFLAARHDSVIAAAHDASVRAYWFKPRTLLPNTTVLAAHPDPWLAATLVHPETGARASGYPYFWFHYLFAHLCQSDPAFREAWRNCSTREADPAHALQWRLLKTELPEPDPAALEALLSASPVHKLNRRMNLPPTFLDVLEKRAVTAT